MAAKSFARNRTKESVGIFSVLEKERMWRGGHKSAAKLTLAWGIGQRSTRRADGVTHISMTCGHAGPRGWLVPLTRSDVWGGFLLIERHAAEGWSYPAQYASPTGTIHSIGGRDPDAEERLSAAFV